MVFNGKTATETNYLVYEIQRGRWLIPRYTISILELRYRSSRMENEVFNHHHHSRRCLRLRRGMASTGRGPWEACRASRRRLCGSGRSRRRLFLRALSAAEGLNFDGPRGREDSFGLIPVHFSAVLCRRRLSLWSINPRWVEEGDEEAAKTVASSWGQDWGSDTSSSMNCTSLALGGCVRGSLLVGATSA